MTQRDRAYAVADAGIQAALFRLNATGGTTGATGSLTNGATYSYTVSPLSQGGSCAGLWVEQTGTGQAVQQDCIGSTGTVGGYSVRVEDRVVAFTPTSQTFPVPGVFAVTGFSAGNNITVGSSSDATTIASNGPINWGGGNSTVDGTVEYLPTACSGGSSCLQSTCSGTCTPSPLSSPLSIPTDSATDYTAYVNALATNNDAALNWGSKMTYNSSTHSVSAASGTGGTVTFPPGTYYFCNISAANSTTLQASASATPSNPVVIYIDSPYDGYTGGALSATPGPGGCATGTGNITAGNNFVVQGVLNHSADFQVYIYGEPQCPTSPAVACPDNFSMNDQAYQDVQLFAPYSQLTTMNNLTLKGEFVVGSISVSQNAVFDYVNSGGTTGSGSNTPAYYPSAQQICTTGSSC